ncbi:DMT family transporter [Micromonospora sp. NPDC047707]|uniref:DMT family transporter n=1 Tax=Micromonospora sp. NPDC047707 TaxID=3154498 RepID=UPI0034520BA3
MRLLVPGIVAGIVVAIGLVLFYGALAQGPVAVVTPLAASAAAIPVAVGAARGEAPDTLGWVGLAITATGILVLAFPQRGTAEPNPSPSPSARPSCPDEQGAHRPRLPAALSALLAAVAFGSAFVLVDYGGLSGVPPLWVAAGLQIGGTLGLVPIVVMGRRARLAVEGKSVGLVLIAGLLAAGGDVALATAVSIGPLALVAVLASLDSAVSVLLAQLLLHERMTLRQAAGVTAALGGAILLAAG